MSKFGHLSVEETNIVRESLDVGHDLDQRQFGRNYIYYVGQLAILKENNETSELITDANSNYRLSQLDYFPVRGERQIIGTRYIAKIFAGERTELAFWADIKYSLIDVNKGSGSLVLAQPDKDDETRTFRVDANITPTVIVPSKSFYTLIADSNGSGLVVSSYYGSSFSWEDAKYNVEVGQAEVDTKEGKIPVPVSFRRFADADALKRYESHL